jgi:NADP-dependent 3-hydroxy acid dehydrogenase YdfG
VLIHNPHVLTIKPFEQTTSDDFEQAWRVACLGAMISVQSIIPHMAARQLRACQHVSLP